MYFYLGIKKIQIQKFEKINKNSKLKRIKKKIKRAFW